MKWMTRSHVHVGRVACPWLIKRFVDSDAGPVGTGAHPGAVGVLAFSCFALFFSYMTVRIVFWR